MSTKTKIYTTNVKGCEMEGRVEENRYGEAEPLPQLRPPATPRGSPPIRTFPERPMGKAPFYGVSSEEEQYSLDLEVEDPEEVVKELLE